MNTLNEVSLHDFFAVIIVSMFDCGMELPQDDEIWHRTFYRFTRKNPECPERMKKLRFNWDGPSPVAPDVHNALWTFRCSESIYMVCGSAHDTYNEGMIEFWKRTHSYLIRESKPQVELFLKFMKEVIVQKSISAKKLALS